jgi:peptidoglycan/LPS O-acetylase OafA/YrhL
MKGQATAPGIGNGSNGSKEFESLAGIWKLLCAMAVLVGHNLVTLTTWRPHDGFWQVFYHVVQFFSPLHFFFFSGYLAVSGLRDATRSLRGMMVGRALRIYVLIVAALAWGLVARIAVKHIACVPSLGTVWPLEVWDGPIHWEPVLRHLNPFGFADHIQFNYAVWYLYQELRIVLLFPLFRWILRRRASFSRWSWAAALLFAAAVMEYRFWPHFPLFRSSPFQSVGFGMYFLCGSLVRLELAPDGGLARLPRTWAWIALAVGVLLSFFESMGIRPPVDNPQILMLSVLAGQILVVVGLERLWGNFRIPTWARRACDGSVGIYIVHPPIHIVAVWVSLERGEAWPMGVGIVLSVVAGFMFHRFVERPSQVGIKRLMAVPR